MYKVVYNSNPNKSIEANHKGSLLFLTDISEREFDSQYEALKFRSECSSPITTIEEICPECSQQVLHILELGEFEEKQILE